MKTANYGVGLDPGTMNIVSARRSGTGIDTKRMRDAFMSLPPNKTRMLKLSQTSFVEREHDVLLLGDAAMEMANVFGGNPSRPLAGGLIAAGESDALDVLKLLIKSVLGEPQIKNEVCYFSVPAPPLDQPEKDIIYHQGVFERIIEECGFDPFPANEAMAIIFSECASEGFSGLSFSFGCLTPETQIITAKGLLPISQVQVGDKVLTRKGQYSPVAKTWVREHTGSVYHLDFYGNPAGVTLTGNHQVWVRRGGSWLWVRADELKPKDVVGEPVVSTTGKTLTLSYSERVACSVPTKTVRVLTAKVARFLGYFLADGHTQTGSKKRKRRGAIYITFGPNEDEYVQDALALIHDLFQRKAHVIKHGRALRVSFSHRGLHSWLRRKCYTKAGVKAFPFVPDDVSLSASLGFLVGLVRGDGWVTRSGGQTGVHFGNSSLPLITAFHILVGKSGFTSTLTKRDPRDTVFPDGHKVVAKDCLPEWVVQVTGADGARLAYLVENPPSKVSPKVWCERGFRCTRLRSIEQTEYSGDVHDLTIDGDHSFVAPYMTLHNSGMANVALSLNTTEVLSFSIQRGGDWVDKHAAQAVGMTQAQMCALKEGGIDLMTHETQPEEALALYYKAMIEFALDQVAAHFIAQSGKFTFPKPIPIIVSGGTSLAGGFLDFFNKVWRKKKRKFPIEISEIRSAVDPLNAVAYGMLVQAMQEYKE